MGNVKTKIECSRITEGIRFDKPVFFNDGKNMFLAAGCPAKKYHLEALRRWEIPFLWTDGDEVPAAGGEALEAASAPAAAPAPKSPAKKAAPPSPLESVDLASFDTPKEAAASSRPKAVSYSMPSKPNVDRSGEEEVSIEDFIENFDEL